ncbi:MAG: RCC1 domain-containing protein [Sandaracinaceae bacterium]
MRRISLALIAASLGACTTPLPIFDDGGPPGIDAGAMDGGLDAGTDAGGDAGVDGGLDAGPSDAGFDGGFDGGFDAGPPPSIVQVSVGSWHSCALLDTGRVLCWGGDFRGMLGDGATDESFASDRADPQPVVGITNASAIYAGWDATCAIDATDGSAMCWGLNNPERFGDGVGDQTTPTPVPLYFPGVPEPILELDHNGSHLCVRTAARVFCSGRNNLHQLGRDGANSHLLSEVLGLPFGRTLRARWPSATVRRRASPWSPLDDGTVWCFGGNDDWSVDGGEHRGPCPRRSRLAHRPGRAGNDFACALDDMGAVRCWGATPMAVPAPVSTVAPTWWPRRPSPSLR